MRRTRRITIAIAVALAILATVAAAAVAAAAPPKSLTNQFPLGSKTLSHSATTSHSASHTATTSHSGTKAATPPPPKQATTPPAKHQAAATKHHATSHGPRDWLLIALVAFVVVVVALDVILVRRSRRVDPRVRRTIPKPLLILLCPLYRHDDERDAWILRLIGKHLGPVLRPNGYRSRVSDADAEADEPDDPPDIAAPRLTDPHRAPDPFKPLETTRARPRKDARAPTTHPDREPPPLAIRRRPE